jgi:predicted nucleic-acid-binding protein
VGTPAVIGLDTNLLARYYVEADDDPPTVRQRALARRLIESGRRIAVSKSVILELEWVLRGHYGFDREALALVLNHLLALPQLDIEDRPSVEQAAAHHRAGLDFADALHLASLRACTSVASFDRKLANRVARLKLTPAVVSPP